jgi:hypothetical protein
MITPPFALQACPPGSVTRTGPQARGLLCDDYLTRHTRPPAAGLLIATSRTWIDFRVPPPSNGVIAAAERGTFSSTPVFHGVGV